MKPTVVAQLCAACTLLPNCGNGDSADRRIEAVGEPVSSIERGPSLALDSVRDIVRIGMGPMSRPEAELGVVTAGRLSPNGDYIALLDRVPPHVKVFRRSGDLVGVFVGDGRGPGEGIEPSAIALTDSTILVADAALRRITILTLDGDVRNVQDGLPVTPMAATAECGDDWLLYGPRVDENQSLATWLHRVRLEGDSVRIVTSTVRDSLPARVALGRPSGFVRDGTTYLLLHESVAGARVLRIRCQQDSIALRIEEVAGLEVGGGRGTGSGSDSPEIPVAWAGLASANGLQLIGIAQPSPNGMVTGLVAYSQGVPVGKVRISPMHVLLDSRTNDGILFSATEPVPHVRLIPATGVTGLLMVRKLP